MRTHPSTASRSLLVLLGLVIGAWVTLAAVSPDRARASPQGGADCQWRELGSLNRDAFHGASALDPAGATLYVFGGYAEPGAEWRIENALTAVRFGAVLSRAATRIDPVPVPGAPERAALAGVYRPRLAESALFWIGGRDRSAKASGEIFRYTLASRAWERLNASGSFVPRAEHAAAYDPWHDAIWVIAGEAASCRAAPCPAPQMPTRYLRFDVVTGVSTWYEGPAGAPRAKGGTLVYDSRALRLIFFGGTVDGAKGTSQLHSLDLSDPDVANARWAPMDASGQAPQVAMHGAAYDPERNWMVVHGGVKDNYLRVGQESAEGRTFALDLNADPPRWTVLSATLGEGIQGVMEYLPQHRAVLYAGGRRALAQVAGNTVARRGIHVLKCTGEAAPTPTTPGITPTPGAPTITPPATAEGPGPGWTPQPASPQVCPGLDRQVPRVAIEAALANPAGIQGWNLRCNQGVPPGPWNPLRDALNLQNPGQPYNALFNGLAWECGCR